MPNAVKIIVSESLSHSSTVPIVHRAITVCKEDDFAKIDRLHSERNLVYSEAVKLLQKHCRLDARY